MKLAISVPDEVFREADRAAKRLRLTRSELYARAVKEYVARLRGDAVTEALNQVYAGETSVVDPVIDGAQRRQALRSRW